MGPTYRSKIRSVVAEIERFLDASFYVEIFAQALVKELWLKGVSASVLTKNQGVITIGCKEFVMHIGNGSAKKLTHGLKRSEGLWVPHEVLIVPSVLQEPVAMPMD
jgi:hypothetical protein